MTSASAVPSPACMVPSSHVFVMTVSSCCSLVLLLAVSPRELARLLPTAMLGTSAALSVIVSRPVEGIDLTLPAHRLLPSFRGGISRGVSPASHDPVAPVFWQDIWHCSWGGCAVSGGIWCLSPLLCLCCHPLLQDSFARCPQHPQVMYSPYYLGCSSLSALTLNCSAKRSSLVNAVEAKKCKSKRKDNKRNISRSFRFGSFHSRIGTRIFVLGTFNVP